jgi:hypothetical protein
MKAFSLLIVVLVLSWILPGSSQHSPQGKPYTGGQFPKTVTLTTVPERLTSTNLWCNTVTLVGKSEFRTDNAGTNYIGWSSVDDDQHFPLVPGGEIVITAPPNGQLNLYDIYIDVTVATDSVIAIYF